MTIIDGFSLFFLPGGTKSNLIAILRALNENSEAKNSDFTVLVPKISSNIKAFHQEELNDLKVILKDHIKIKYVPINPLIFEIYKIIGSKDPFIRRYTLYLWERFYLPKEVKKLNPEVIFHPYQAVSDYKTNAKKIVLVLDIFHWTDKNDYSYIVKRLYDSYKKGCVSADKIITISETSKDEIVNYFKIDKEKVAVCYLGIDELFANFKPDPKEEIVIREYFKLPEKYIFGLVSLREYKNSIGIVKVFHEALKKDPNLRLVLFGWPLSSESNVTKYVDENNLEEYVTKIAKPRTNDDLLYFYSMSFVFIFLSTQEGFGLPPLEAISCRTLPLTSNVSAVGEVYNGIIPTFNSDDYEKVASYILSLDEVTREKEIGKAREILLSKYSWDAVLQNYLKYII